jgi:hypothetical protein
MRADQAATLHKKLSSNYRLIDLDLLKLGRTKMFKAMIDPRLPHEPKLFKPTTKQLNYRRPWTSLEKIQTIAELKLKDSKLVGAGGRKREIGHAHFESIQR